ncbi:MAG: hypothetical protein NUV98_07245, partial [Candidatus Roizmanbacteria bacterium]|nr:hypothetical protein [Candidatus Roizmanbacteria bacterium]
KEVEVLGGSTVVERDTNNILTIEPFSDLPDPASHAPDDSERFQRFIIEGDTTQDYFRYSPTGTYLAIPSRGNSRLEMDARGTWQRFVMGGAPELAAQVIMPYGRSIKVLNGHQPSREVVGGYNTMFTRKQLQLQGLSRLDAKKLVVSLSNMSQRERSNALALYNVPDLQMPWDIGNTKFSNVSAATSLIQLCYAAQENRMQPGDIIAEQFMGVGSTYGTYVLQLH